MTDVAKCMNALYADMNLRRATVFVGPGWTVKATRRHRFDARSRQEEFVVTIGRPNYRERKWIADAQEANVKFPVRKVQLTHWPRKKKA